MNDFTASNDIAIRTEDGHLDFKRPDPYGWLGLCGGDVVDALREFFQAEADERLGRWRWPEKPQWVLYPDEDGDVVALDESTGQSSSLMSRITVSNFPDAWACQAAQAFFDAHPEPKPWHDAKPGEVWIVDTRIRTWGGDQGMFVTADRKFYNSSWSIPVTDPDVQSARRIWPEVSS